MEALFLIWSGNTLARVEVLRTVGGVDLNATGRALIEEAWSNGGTQADSCTIYLAQNRRLILAGEEAHVGT